MYKAILVPTDGSNCSNTAIDHALDLAGLFGARLVFLNVIPTLLHSVRPGRDYVDKVIEDIKEASQRLLEESCLKAKAKGVSCSSTSVEFSRPMDAIVDLAKAVDLIVMGSHGRGGIDRVLLGSVTEGVLRRVNKPVLVVRCTGDDQKSFVPVIFKRFKQHPESLKRPNK